MQSQLLPQSINIVWYCVSQACDLQNFFNHYSSIGQYLHNLFIHHLNIFGLFLHIASIRWFDAYCLYKISLFPSVAAAVDPEKNDSVAREHLFLSLSPPIGIDLCASEVCDHAHKQFE